MNPNDVFSKFWVDHFGRDNVVDWDVFINTFVSFVDKHCRVRLQQLQRNQVKRIVDPSSQQEIRLKNFDNFLEDYWVLPINRQKLFKKHFKATDTEFENGFKNLEFTISHTDSQTLGSKTSTYNFRSASLRLGNINHPIKNKGFVTVGSSEQSDIRINNIHVNPVHAKIFKHPLGYKVKDTSKSNRVLMSFDKHLLLSPGMVVRLCSYQLSIVSLRSNQIAQDDQFVRIPVSVSSQKIQVQDTTLTFTLKDTRNQEEKKYSINYKKQFKIGKQPSSDAILYDQRSNNVCCILAYIKENWFLKPSQKAEVYMGTREQIDGLRDSSSMFVVEGMKIEFKGGNISFKLIRN